MKQERNGSMKKLLFVYNQYSGKAQIKNQLMEIIDIFTKADYEVTVHPTQSRGDAIEQMKYRKPDYDLIVCSGGDGTLDEVVTGMMESSLRTPIGYIPAGSTNDFAASLTIPKNMCDAARMITERNLFKCDIGRFQNDTFVYIAAFGLFTDVSYETPQDMKNILGHMAYILEGMKRISNIKSYHMVVTGDDVVLEGDYAYGMVTNSKSVGGFKNITGKDVDLSDGLFEVTLIKLPMNPLELNELVQNLLTQRMEGDLIQSFKTKTLKIEPSEEMSWTLDGENGGVHKEVIISNEASAIDICVPYAFLNQ